MNAEPIVSVGIIDGQHEIKGWLEGHFHAEEAGYVSGGFAARVKDGQVALRDAAGRDMVKSMIRLEASEGALFRLFDVIIGNSFHWERADDQAFRGNLLLLARADGTVTAVNEIPVEQYLASVISSEMRAEAPIEFLKAHAIMSRSWLLAALERKKEPGKSAAELRLAARQADEILRWYEREDHDLFDVCADDHCQRYHGITKIISEQALSAVAATSGRVMTHNGAICDARYSKCCGGLTEDFRTAWEDRKVDYLSSVTDSQTIQNPVSTEEHARRWVLSHPEAYCNTGDQALLRKVLPDFDQETQGFFRWTVTYSRTELEDILRNKSEIDFGRLQEIVPLQRGPSGRISALRIVGSKRSITVGKELEIRRWLSASHLYSSAFVVSTNNGSDGLPETFTFHGAGWGHGVGLCQIGAAVMANEGFSAEEILSHYFRGANIEKVY